MTAVDYNSAKLEEQRNQQLIFKKFLGISKTCSIVKEVAKGALTMFLAGMELPTRLAAHGSLNQVILEKSTCTAEMQAACLD